MGTQSSGSQVRSAVIGLGHVAQVAVPGFKSARNWEIAALVWAIRESGRLSARNIALHKCSRMKSTLKFLFPFLSNARSSGGYTPPVCQRGA
jgi:hypothetical protein